MLTGNDCDGWYFAPDDDDRFIRIGHVTFSKGPDAWLGPPPGFIVEQPAPLRWWQKLARWIKRLFRSAGESR